MTSGIKSTLALERPRRPRLRAETRFGLGALRQAQERIAPFVHRTSVHESRALTEILGTRLFFKCENFQRIGAFKARGVHNAVFSLTKRDAACGVVTHSSGNHAAALAARSLRKSIHVYGVEPAAADDAHRFFKAGKIIPVENPQTIADGLRTSLGKIPFSIIRTGVDEITTVTEPGIVHAMRLVWSVLKIVIEPSAAVAVAALLEGKLPVKGKRVGVILSDGNVDLDRLPWGKPAS